MNKKFFQFLIPFFIVCLIFSDVARSGTGHSIPKTDKDDSGHPISKKSKDSSTGEPEKSVLPTSSQTTSLRSTSHKDPLESNGQKPLSSSKGKRSSHEKSASKQSEHQLSSSKKKKRKGNDSNGYKSSKLLSTSNVEKRGDVFTITSSATSHTPNPKKKKTSSSELKEKSPQKKQETSSEESKKSEDSSSVVDSSGHSKTTDDSTKEEKTLQKNSYDESKLAKLNKVEYDPERDLCFYTYSKEDLEQKDAVPDTTIDKSCIFYLDTKLTVPYYEPTDLKSWLEREGMEEEKNLLVPNNHGKFPWHVHGCLMIRDGNKRFRASSMLIDSQYVLTAGHNIFDRENGTVADKITFYPGMHGDIILDAIKGEAVAIDKDFLEETNERKNNVKHLDLAVIKLEREVDFSFYYKLSDFTEKQANDTIKNITITGYPGYNPFWGRFMTNKELSFTKIKDGMLPYNGSTRKGQSGSAVWIKSESNTRTEYTVIGVHTHGKNYGEEGSAVFLNKKNVARIKKWKEALKSNNQ